MGPPARFSYYSITYRISACVGSSAINAENTMKHRYRLGPIPNLRGTNLSNSLEQISNHKSCSTIRRSKVSVDFSSRLRAESPVLYRSVGFSSSQFCTQLNGQSEGGAGFYSPGHTFFELSSQNELMQRATLFLETCVGVGGCFSQSAH